MFNHQLKTYMFDIREYYLQHQTKGKSLRHEHGRNLQPCIFNHEGSHHFHNQHCVPHKRWFVHFGMEELQSSSALNPC
uniref:Uncharacterized protein n=1 Tax=Pyxicephalus adspersus TaxID=30357 RepID=A0AAV3ACY3_PYXAD|nr:TPA: hypothetical protein GDO54_009904 [Pyxicephalus adspersus]